jgi:hypothetical protein
MDSTADLAMKRKNTVGFGKISCTNINLIRASMFFLMACLIAGFGFGSYDVLHLNEVSSFQTVFSQ